MASPPERTSAPEDIANALRNAGLGEIGAPALAALAGGATLARFAAGKVVASEGGGDGPLGGPGELLVIARGAVKLVRGYAGAAAPPDPSELVAPLIVGLVRGPGLVIDPSVIDGRGTSFGVVAMRSTDVVRIPHGAVDAALASSGTFARLLLARFADAARAELEALDDMVAGSASDRLRRRLASLARRYGTPVGGGRFVPFPLRRRDFAQMIHATPETVSRLLAKLEREGAIRSTRDGVLCVSVPPSSARLPRLDSTRSAASSPSAPSRPSRAGARPEEASETGNVREASDAPPSSSRFGR